MQPVLATDKRTVWSSAGFWTRAGRHRIAPGRKEKDVKILGCGQWHGGILTSLVPESPVRLPVSPPSTDNVPKGIVPHGGVDMLEYHLGMPCVTSAHPGVTFVNLVMLPWPEIDS